MFAQSKKQLDSVNSTIDKLEREIGVLRGEFDNYGDEVKVVEPMRPKMQDVFRLLRGGKP